MSEIFDVDPASILIITVPPRVDGVIQLGLASRAPSPSAEARKYEACFVAALLTGGRAAAEASTPAQLGAWLYYEVLDPLATAAAQDPEFKDNLFADIWNLKCRFDDVPYELALTLRKASTEFEPLLAALPARIVAAGAFDDLAIAAHALIRAECGARRDGDQRRIGMHRVWEALARAVGKIDGVNVPPDTVKKAVERY